MKLSEIRDDYVRYSTRLGDINRQLIFAGIAIVWLFRISDKNGSITIPEALLYPLLLFIISFLCDILQYLYQSVTWYIYYWRKKQKDTDEEAIQVNESECINIPSWIFWLLKILCLILGYYKLAGYLLVSLFPDSTHYFVDFFKNLF